MAGLTISELWRVRRQAGRRRGRLRHILVLRLAVMTVHGLEISRLDLGPERASDLAVADLTQCILPSSECSVGVAAVTALLIAREDVVLPVLD